MLACGTRRSRISALSSHVAEREDLPRHSLGLGFPVPQLGHRLYSAINDRGRMDPRTRTNDTFLFCSDELVPERFDSAGVRRRGDDDDFGHAGSLHLAADFLHFLSVFSIGSGKM